MTTQIVLAMALAPMLDTAVLPICQSAPAEEAAARDMTAYPPHFFADSSPATALDMILRLPGFSFDRGAQVRGLAGAGGNVLIDGQPPVIKNDPLDDVLRRIPAASVARIEVIRGGAPGIDMQGRSIIANVVRKSGAGFRGAITASETFVYDGRNEPGVRAEGQWRWDERLLELSAIGGRGADDWSGDGRRIRYAPDGHPLIVSQVDSDGEGIRKWLTGAFDTPLGGGRLRVNGAYMLSPADVETTDRLIVPPGREYEYLTRGRLHQEFGARFNRDLGSKLALEVIGLRQSRDDEVDARFEGPGLSRVFALESLTEEAVGRGTLKYRPATAWELQLGAETALNTLESRTRLTQNAIQIPVPAADVQVEERRGEVFGTVTWRGSPSFSVEAGVRQESSTISSEGDVALEKSLSFTKPRLTLAWSATEADQIRLRMEREVGQLNFNDFVASNSVVNSGDVLAGNPDLTPQKAWVVEAAWERRFWSSGAVVLTLRHFELSDVVDRIPIVGAGGVIADAPGNIGEGTKDEAQLSLTVPLQHLGLPRAQLRGQATWRRSEVTDPITGAAREISLLQPQAWELHFTQDVPRWKSVWGFDALSGFRERAYLLRQVETIKLGTWTALFIDYKPRPDIVVRLELQNVGERGHTRVREVYAGPRGGVPISYTDVRDLQFGRNIYIRVRKSLGR